MNSELKSIVLVIVDGVKAVEAELTHKNFATVVLPLLYKIGADIPSVVTNFSSLAQEIEELPGSAQEADLVNYISQNLSGVISDTHAQGILNAILKLVGNLGVDVTDLVFAIKAP